LSIGREIFANIEQVNLFVVPPRSTAGEGETTKHIASCFGLALTSRNPQHTHQLVTAILEVANLLATLSTNEQSVEHSNTAAGRYVLPLGHDQKIDCYIGQRNKTTILAFSGEVLDASLSAIEDKKSALTVGVLQEPLKKVTADTSKMLLINVGGAIKVADAYINMTYDNPQNPAHKTLAQLAQACGKTYVQLRTGESDDNFNLHISINQLPPLDSVFGLLMQLSKTDLTAQAKATKPQPGNGTVMGLKEDMKLDWKPGINATSHKVYFGTAADELSFLAEVSKPVEAKLPVLQEDDRYYWRVDEVWSDGTIITGDTWSFSIGKLIGWWKFDETEGSNAHDSSGSGHTGTLLGNPRWQPARGRVGGALEFDGDGDYVNLGKKSDFDITEQITVAAWIKVNRFDKEWQAIVSKGDSSWRVQRVRETDSLEFACSGLQVPGTQWGGIYGKISVNDGQWHHATGVYDGKKLSLYVDGKLDVSVNAPGKINVNDYPVYIGENAERTGRFWNGLIDDVRVYNYALSQEEIEALCRFNASEPRPVEGAVVGPEMKVKLNWTPGIGASASKVFFGTKSDQLSPLAEVTNPAYAGLPALEKDTKYYWRIDNVQANGVVVSGDIWSFTTSGKLVGWWKLDESSGTTAHDSSGRGNHGTLIGDTQWVADGLIGGALYFNDSNDTTCRVEIPTEGMSASAGTIALQAKLSPNPPSTEVFTRYFFGHTTIPYYNNRIQLYLDQTTMTLDLGLGDSHNRKMNMAPLDVETWYHIALTWNDGTYVVYLDGQKLATGTYTGLSTINTIANIGNDGGELDEAFDGTIDDVRIYNYALGEGDILALVREN
ncbi:MAG: LamG domain-containing protein, partial [Phycisphaerae bacterium]